MYAFFGAIIGAVISGGFHGRRRKDQRAAS
ncbi:hypothetical protein RKD18_001217 [Streptomyces phaeoluteigriseus]